MSIPLHLACVDTITMTVNLCTGREEEGCSIRKPFPFQESRVLAEAFKQLLNIWVATELNVLEKCGERVHLLHGIHTRIGYETRFVGSLT